MAVNESDSLKEGFSFFTFLFATVFMVVFSNDAINDWPPPWNQGSIILVLALTGVAFFVWRYRYYVAFRQYSIITKLAAIIAFLGILNIVFSDVPKVTLKSMSLFLATSLFVLELARFLFESQVKRRIFALFSCYGLIALSIFAVYEYYKVVAYNHKGVMLFAGNSIPAGALILLLLTAPFYLLSTDQGLLSRIIGVTGIFLAGIAIILIAKRGAVIGIAGMVLFLFLFLPKNRVAWGALIAAILLFMLGYALRDHIPNQLRKHFLYSMSTMDRVEDLFFAAHVIRQNPVLGTGMHAPLNTYFSGYKMRFRNDNRWIDYIYFQKTLENTLVTGVATMGSIFTLSYLGLLAACLGPSFRKILFVKKNYKFLVFTMGPMIAFLIDSFTFDSLVFPQLNWLFHTWIGFIMNMDHAG